MEWIELECDISDVYCYISDGYDVEAMSPDGYVPVIAYVEKGIKQSYKIFTAEGCVVASYDHLFETNYGWVFSRDLDITKHLILSNQGYVHFTIEFVGPVEVVDLSIDHPNHRYYTNGLSSHNTNVGKSLVMASLAVANVYHNKKVLYISCEMSEEKIGERINANAFDIPISDLAMLSREKLHKKYDEHKQFSNMFVLKEYPPRKLNANKIRNLLKELKLKKNCVPDVVYLDYLALMMPNVVTKGQAKHEDLTVISEEVRAVAVEYDLPIVSAVQVGRDGISSTDIDLDDIAGSVGITFTADIIIAMTQSDEMLQAGKYCLTIIKNRYGQKKCWITVLVDFEKMRIVYDEENDTLEYATKDGKNPNAPTHAEKAIAKEEVDEYVTIARKKKDESTRPKLFDFE